MKHIYAGDIGQPRRRIEAPEPLPQHQPTTPDTPEQPDVPEPAPEPTPR